MFYLTSFQELGKFPKPRYIQLDRYSEVSSMGLTRKTEFYTLHLFLEIKPLSYFPQGESPIHFDSCKALFHGKEMIMTSVTVIAIYTIINLPKEGDSLYQIPSRAP